MTYIHEDPPDENTAYEPFDEDLDDRDIPGHGPGPEGQRDIDSDIVADHVALHEAGADLDDPDRLSLLDGGMDDPDGSGPPEEAGDGEEADGGAGGGGSIGGVDVGEPEDPELEIIDVDATELDQVPDDAPGPDSARW